MSERFRRAQLPTGPSAPAVARTAITDWLGDSVAASAIEDIKLLVSELVTNAVRHPAQTGPIEMNVAVGGRRIRVEVSDAGKGFTKPTIKSPPPDSLGGRGLLIVDRVASRWGVTPGDPTRVWFELDR